MNHKDARQVIARFTAHLDNHYYTYLPVEARHFRLVTDWIGMFKLNLRALDALHLAIASSEGWSVVTADKSLSNSGKALGVNVQLLG